MHIPKIEAFSVRLLLCELPILLLSAVVVLISYIYDAQFDLVGANFYYVGMLQYLEVSLVIIFSSTVVLDLVCKETNGDFLQKH